MKVLVYGYAYLRDVVGEELVLDMSEGSLVGELLSELRKKFPSFREHEGALLLLLNGRELMSRWDFALPLRDRDQVELIPLIGGG